MRNIDVRLAELEALIQMAYTIAFTNTPCTKPGWVLHLEREIAQCRALAIQLLET